MKKFDIYYHKIKKIQRTIEAENIEAAVAQIECSDYDIWDDKAVCFVGEKPPAPRITWVAVRPEGDIPEWAQPTKDRKPE